MKRNFSAAIKNLDGKPLKEGDKEVTIGSIAVNALLTPYEDERNLSGDDKVKRFRLAQAIHGADDEIEVTAEQVTLLKTLIAKAYTPLIVGQAYDLLEADPVAS